MQTSHTLHDPAHLLQQALLSGVSRLVVVLHFIYFNKPLIQRAGVALLRELLDAAARVLEVGEHVEERALLAPHALHPHRADALHARLVVRVRLHHLLKNCYNLYLPECGKIEVADLTPLQCRCDFGHQTL